MLLFFNKIHGKKLFIFLSLYFLKSNLLDDDDDDEDDYIIKIDEIKFLVAIVQAKITFKKINLSSTYCTIIIS